MAQKEYTLRMSVVVTRSRWRTFVARSLMKASALMVKLAVRIAATQYTVHRDEPEAR